MRICCVLQGISLTGGVVVIVEMAQGLQRLGHDVTIAHSGWRREEGWIPQSVRLRGPALSDRLVRRLLMRGHQSPSWLDHTNQWIIARRLPPSDVYITTASNTVLPVASAASSSPRVHFMMHDERLVNSDDPVKAGLAAEAIAIAPNRWANSSWLASRIEAATGLRPHLVFPAVDHSQFLPAMRAGRRRPDVDGPLRVISLVKDIPVKGLDILIDAMGRATRQRELVWVGYGSSPHAPQREFPCPFEYHTNVAGRALAALYRTADLFVSASLLESFPLPPLEAMACGVPVVTTSIGTEDYAQDGVNSLVVPPSDPDALSRAILRLAGDSALQARVSEGGLRTAARFTWDKTASRAHELLVNLTAGSVA